MVKTVSIIPPPASNAMDEATGDLQEHARRAYALAYRMLGNRADAEDVAQEVMIRLLKHWGRLAWSRNVPGWLHRVTVNCSLDVLRFRKRQVALPDEALATPARSPDVLDLWTLMDTLTERERTALSLVFGEGMSCREAALVMVCLPSTVRVLCHRARKKMRAFLDQSCQESGSDER